MCLACLQVCRVEPGKVESKSWPSFQGARPKLGSFNAVLGNWRSSSPRMSGREEGRKGTDPRVGASAFSQRLRTGLCRPSNFLKEFKNEAYSYLVNG